MLPPDYHTHNYLCKHAIKKPVDYVKAAINENLLEIGLSDHAPMQEDNYDDWRMLLDDLKLYIQMAEEARDRYPQIPVRIGLEVDYIPEYEDWIKELSEIYPWDYLIGSVHYIDNKWDIDNPHKEHLWINANVNQVWQQYFERMTLAAESGFFDILGHCDLVKKFGFMPSCDCKPFYRQFLRAASKTKTAIEINTSGAYKECKEVFPAYEILHLAYTEGVSLSFGSDSHTPETVGRDFQKALEMAVKAGYTSSILLNKRKVENISLSQFM